MTILPFFARFSFSYYTNIIVFLIVISITIRIILDNRNPLWSLSMLIFLYFFPVLAIPFYFLNGVNWKKRKIVKHIPERIFKDNLAELIKIQKMFLKNVPSTYDNDAVKNVRMLLNSSGAILTLQNDIELFFNGEELFDSLLSSLEKAEQSIHMEYFIWRSDELGEKIAEILKRKVVEGVEVRILFDGVGCFGAMSRRYKRRLKKAGIQTRYFLNPLNIFTGRLLNYCNHRKVVVIDGKTAFMGGMNIGHEYINGGKRFDNWRDTHLKCKGDSVGLLQAVFLADWENSGAKVQNERNYISSTAEIYDDLPIQIVTSGPDSNWNSLKDLYFNMISNANEEVLIASPYFVVDESIEEALITSALSGVKVKIIMAGYPPDKRVPYWVAHTYYENLMEAGVEFYQYQDGFFHSKYLLSDGKTATVGTCNMDIRSFQLHYEINAVIYSNRITQKIKDNFKESLSKSRKITLEECSNMFILKKMRNSLFRLIAPLL